MKDNPMRQFKIVYFDNTMDGVCLNKTDDIEPLLNYILDWVFEHEAHLHIKTKERPAMRVLRHGKTWMFWRKIQAKLIYNKFSENTQEKIILLRHMGYVDVSNKPGDKTPALNSDAIIVIPYGEIAIELASEGKDVVFFDKWHMFHHNGIMRGFYPIRKKCWLGTDYHIIGNDWKVFSKEISERIEFFDKPEDIVEILDRKYNSVLEQ